MKSCILLLLLSLVAVSAFAPPQIHSSRVVSVAPSRVVVHMAGPAVEEKTNSEVAKAGDAAEKDECDVEKEEMSETQKLMQQVKDSGTAGIISYALWELAFWAFSVPVCIVGYQQVTGHWPDLSNSDDLSKLGAEAFAFVNFARFAVPLRIGLALSTTSWIQENVVDRFMKKDEEEC